MNRLLKLNRRAFIKYSKKNQEAITPSEYKESVDSLLVAIKTINIKDAYLNLKSDDAIPYNHQEDDNGDFPYTFPFDLL